MRYGILSDIHANRFALRSAIDALRAEGVDQWLCVGDIVGWGPHPNECVEIVAELEAVTVTGNHELMALDVLTEERCGRMARESTRWTRAEIRADARTHLGRLPVEVTLGDLFMTHASLEGPLPYVRSAGQAKEQLRRVADEKPGTEVLVLGHTHQQMVCSATGELSSLAAGRTLRLPDGGPVLLNPGAVGQSRDRESTPRARCMLYDSDRREVLPLALPYDHAACRTALRERGLRSDAVHQRAGVIPMIRRRSRSAWRDLRRAASNP
ncbi:metallophosphoesterase family protein [Actinomycetospora straminea]|uniref:Metallophosphoesterase family protein n=1 Tax=Actinomycetospora straminea TaxID=663607 RepID=A0ABP9E329_9PSEU|nr:metallophosphoesterase family protein [Actinomycetospora straminea]MDD7931041.1 metallophosphoesterase family protein [Actinomycetospora straminea]